MFFADKRAEYKPREAELIEIRLNKAATWHNIKQACDEIKAKIAADATHDLGKVPDSDFALVYVTDAGKSRHYPLRNGNEVKMASDWFMKYRDEFVFTDRNTIAKKILEKAAQYGVSIPDADTLSKTAGYGYCSGEDIADMLNQRASLVAKSSPEYCFQMRKLAATCDAHKATARDSSVKIASIVDQFDRQTKLNQMYDAGGLDRPEEVLFQVTEKVANDFINDHFQMTSGTVYEKSAFSEVSVDHIQKWMGDAFADEVSTGGLYTDPEKVADIAATLPRPEATMFDRMANAAGVNVFARDKAASDEGLSLKEMMDLADQYAPGHASF
jgi:hypothetical protein